MPDYDPAEVTALAEANRAREASLVAQGVRFGPEVPFRLTVMALKDMLLEGDPAAELEFGARYQAAFAYVLDDAQQQLNRAKLVGGNGRPPEPPTLLRP